jgi:hypothetical protein
MRVFLLLLLSHLASAANPTAWRLVKPVTAARDGLTQFEVLEANERGGRVRITRSPRDLSCPTGATYLMSWRIDGETRRVALGQSLLVSFEGHQTGGGRCANGEPLARAATGLGAIDMGWAPGTFYSFEGPGYREFYLHPEEHADRHLGQWKVTVPTNAYQQHLFLAIGIDTSGNSGGQWFNFALIYEAEKPGAKPLPPAPPQNPPPPPAQNPPPPARGAYPIKPAYLGTLYHSSSYYEIAYVMTITAPDGKLDARIRSTGSFTDPRHLTNWRLVDSDTFEGEWQSDPLYDNPKTQKRGVLRGTFRAGFYGSSGNTWYITFKTGSNSEVPEAGDMWNSWFRNP